MHVKMPTLAGYFLGTLQSPPSGTYLSLTSRSMDGALACPLYSSTVHSASVQSTVQCNVQHLTVEQSVVETLSQEESDHQSGLSRQPMTYGSVNLPHDTCTIPTHHHTISTQKCTISGYNIYTKYPTYYHITKLLHRTIQPKALLVSTLSSVNPSVNLPNIILSPISPIFLYVGNHTTIRPWTCVYFYR